MKSLITFVCLLPFLTFASAESLKTGTYEGKSWKIWKCSLEIEKEEFTNRYGQKDYVYTFTASKRGKEYKFSAFQGAVDIGLKYGEVSGMTGTDNVYASNNQTIDIKTNSDGSPESFEAFETTVLFGFTDKDTLMTCDSLNKVK